MLKQYYNEECGRVFFSREQGSRFAKCVAGDFNPLHNVDAKKFCVPGDLLFALVLEKYGISEHMEFSFTGMVAENTRLIYPEAASLANELLVIGDGDKDYMSVRRQGTVTTEPTVVQNLIDKYVSFSGKTFPHILVPLMSQKNVMINPLRPMVMYQSMLIHLDSLDIGIPDLEFTTPVFELNGKRGDIVLPFKVKNGSQELGHGEKRMLVSGLRPYDETQINDLITEYNLWSSDTLMCGSL